MQLFPGQTFFYHLLVPFAQMCSVSFPVGTHAADYAVWPNHLIQTLIPTRPRAFPHILKALPAYQHITLLQNDSVQSLHHEENARRFTQSVTLALWVTVEKHLLMDLLYLKEACKQLEWVSISQSQSQSAEKLINHIYPAIFLNHCCILYTACSSNHPCVAAPRSIARPGRKLPASCISLVRAWLNQKGSAPALIKQTTR